MDNDSPDFSPAGKKLTGPGTLILLLSIAMGAALLLLSIELAGRLDDSELEHLKTVTELVAVAAGFPAAIFALFNYAADVSETKRAELWRRRQFVDERFSRFEANPKVEAAMTMLDYWDRPVSLPGSGKRVMVSNDLLTRALSAGKSKLVMNEVLIRDAFDEFFDGMDRLGIMWDVGLISLEDLLPYVRYWLELLDSPSRHRNEEFGPVVRSYIHKFHFEALERLLKAAGLPVCSEEDEEIVEIYKKGNRKPA